ALPHPDPARDPLRPGRRHLDRAQRGRAGPPRRPPAPGRRHAMTATSPALRRVVTTVASSALLLWAAATIVFLLQHLVPGDPALTILGGASANRSEEHTSELQSRFDLVCRLLLDKKKDRGNDPR